MNVYFLMLLLFHLKESTARVIWSFREMDDPTRSDGSDAMKHSHRGTASLNLLGGQPITNHAVSNDEPFLDFRVTNVCVCLTVCELLSKRLFKLAMSSVNVVCFCSGDYSNRPHYLLV